MRKYNSSLKPVGKSTEWRMMLSMGPTIATMESNYSDSSYYEPNLR